MEGESGPKLDLRLPCWDIGRIDSLRIQEPFDDTESRGSSTIGTARPESPCLAKGRRVAGGFVGVIWACGARRGIRPCAEVALTGIVGCCSGGNTIRSWGGSGGAVDTAELVPGREKETGFEKSWSVTNFRLTELGLLWGVFSSLSASWPKTSPVAAAATAVPAPISYRRISTLVK